MKNPQYHSSSPRTRGSQASTGHMGFSRIPALRCAAAGMTISLLLAGCDSIMGPSPDDYITGTAVTASGQLNIAANKVVPEASGHDVQFDHGTTDMDPAAKTFIAALKDNGVQTAEILIPPGDQFRDAHVLAITRALRASGIENTRISSRISTDLVGGDYRVEVVTASVKGPNCPNWSSSPTTSGANLPFSQMGCSITTNIGQMVQDPKHLERGVGNSTPNAARNSAAIQTYETNASTSTSSSSEGSGESSSSTSGTSGTSSASTSSSQ